MSNKKSNFNFELISKKVFDSSKIIKEKAVGFIKGVDKEFKNSQFYQDLKSIKIKKK